GAIEPTALDSGDEARGVTPGDDEPVLGSREHLASAQARALHHVLAEDVDEHLDPATLVRRGRQRSPALAPRLVAQAALLEVGGDIGGDRGASTLALFLGGIEPAEVEQRLDESVKLLIGERRRARRNSRRERWRAALLVLVEVDVGELGGPPEHLGK